MPRYAVSYTSFLQEDILTEIVTADNKIDALSKHSMIEGIKFYADTYERILGDFNAARITVSATLIEDKE
mgnify:CR=1 FL=1